MLHVFLAALVLYLLIARSDIGYRYVVSPVSRLLNRLEYGEAALLWEQLTDCPLCLGFWLSVGAALVLGAGFWEWAAAYLLLVGGAKVYDYMDRE